MPITQTFTDFSLDFIPHPVTGDISILRNEDAVKRAIKNLIYTDVYERPYASGRIGSGVRQLLFQNISPMTEKAIELSIRDTINAYEKRATVIDVKASVNADSNGYDVTLTFSIDQISKIISVDLFLERIR